MINSVSSMTKELSPNLGCRDIIAFSIIGLFSTGRIYVSIKHVVHFPSSGISHIAKEKVSSTLISVFCISHWSSWQSSLNSSSNYLQELPSQTESINYRSKKGPSLHKNHLHYDMQVNCHVRTGTFPRNNHNMLHTVGFFRSVTPCQIQ